jgi:hypothetical protein
MGFEGDSADLNWSGVSVFLKGKHQALRAYLQGVTVAGCWCHETTYCFLKEGKKAYFYGY